MMPRMFERDVNTEAEGMATPGIDPRQWGSYALVDQDTPDAHSVLYTDVETGNPYPFPMVLVTLQPSGIPIPCRVAASASGAAGKGEGEWSPFVAGDEVYVLLPEGHERAGGIIIARFNQAHDTFPTMVAGADTTQNSFAFRRQRAPYIFETSSSYLVRSAGTKAFLSLNQEGVWTIANGESDMLRLGTDFLALQLGTNDAMVQVLPASGSQTARVFLQGDQAQLLVDAATTSLLTPGNVSFASAGNLPLEHVTTIEAVVNLFAALGAALAALPPAPLTTTSLGALLVGAPFAAVILAAGALGLAPTSVTALIAALAIPKGPNKPGVGCPGFLVG